MLGIFIDIIDSKNPGYSFMPLQTYDLTIIC